MLLVNTRRNRQTNGSCYSLVHGTLPQLMRLYSSSTHARHGNCTVTGHIISIDLLWMAPLSVFFTALFSPLPLAINKQADESTLESKIKGLLWTKALTVAESNRIKNVLGENRFECKWSHQQLHRLWAWLYWTMCARHGTSSQLTDTMTSHFTAVRQKTLICVKKKKKTFWREEKSNDYWHRWVSWERGSWDQLGLKVSAQVRKKELFCIRQWFRHWLSCELTARLSQNSFVQLVE